MPSMRLLSIFSLLFFGYIYCANNIGCNLDKNICEIYEYCNSKYNYYGRCESLYALENEKRIEYIDESYKDANNYRMPIKIHKYNAYDYDSNENDDYSNESDDESMSLRQYLTNDYQDTNKDYNTNSIYIPDYVDLDDDNVKYKQKRPFKRDLKANNYVEKPSLRKKIIVGLQHDDDYEKERQQEIYERLLDLVKRTQNTQYDIDDNNYVVDDDEYIKDYLAKIKHESINNDNNDDLGLYLLQNSDLNTQDSFDNSKENDDIYDTNVSLNDYSNDDDDDDETYIISKHLSLLENAYKDDKRAEKPLETLNQYEIYVPIFADYDLKTKTNDNSIELNDVLSSELKLDEREIDTLKHLIKQQELSPEDEEEDEFNDELKDLLLNNLKAYIDDDRDEVEKVEKEEEEDSFALVKIDKNFANTSDAIQLLRSISNVLQIPLANFKNISIIKSQLAFKIKPNTLTKRSKDVIDQLSTKKDEISKNSGFNILSLKLSKNNNDFNDSIVEKKPLIQLIHSNYFIFATIAICSSIFTILIFLIALYLLRRRAYLRNKLFDSVLSPTTSNSYHFLSGNLKNEKNYTLLSNQNEIKKGIVCEEKSKIQDTCDQSTIIGNTLAMCDSSFDEKVDLTMNLSLIPSTASPKYIQPKVEMLKQLDESNRSSTSSWSEEPITTTNLDITTGHVILSYMESYLNDKNKISKEWQALCGYVSDYNQTSVAQLPQNMDKNRYKDILPCKTTPLYTKLNWILTFVLFSSMSKDDRNRIILKSRDRDYINASAITDSDPKNIAYIASQGPLLHTTSDFWQMIWDQSSSTIVCLTKPNENGVFKCSQYWPTNGNVIYERFEINLVSEHVWCDDYLVRSFYLKNIVTSETRTVTQFHFLTWMENDLPSNIKSLLDFKRKVNKSYKNASCPIVVHCNDGIGRTGTYILIDMVLNRIISGAREIDIGATLEFLRDQRSGIVKTQEQFEFSFAVIAEELQNMLKALSLSIQ